MLQSYYQIQNEIKSVNQWLLFNNQIQKIYSSSYYLNFVIRTPGKTKNLIIGRGGKGQGIWEFDTQLPSKLRGKDHLLDYVRKYLIGMRLENIELDQNDLILRFNFFKYPNERSSLFIFYKKNETYFSYQYCVDAFWHNFGPINTTVSENRSSYEKFDAVGRSKQQYNIIEKPLIKFNVDDIFKEESSEIVKKQNKKQKFIQKKIENIKSDLAMFENRHKIVEMITADEIDFESLPTKAEILGIKIKFKSIGHYPRRDELYNKIKGLNIVEKHLNTRLVDSIAQLEKINVTNKDETNEHLFQVNWPLHKKETKDVVEKSENQIIIKKYDGYTFGIGKDAGGNDYLRSKWGLKNDLWFHSEAGSSQHVVVKVIKEGKWDEIIKNITHIFLPNGGDMNLIYTQLKNVKGIKGSKGLVEYKKEKHIRIIN